MAHFIRHRLTWGYTHIALGCVRHYAVSYYIAELLELGTAFGLEFLERYDRIKIAKILEAITIQGELLKGASNPSAFTSKDQAKDWLSSQLSQQDETLIQNTRLALNVPQMGGAFHKETGADSYRQTQRDRTRGRGTDRASLRSRSKGPAKDRRDDRARIRQLPRDRDRTPPKRRSN